ncbi:hypothetical protein FOCC_FOCC016377 [Frankliniella occidentalis]|nr:hypothetical protein FOCC_FOCC016377 [Frankliniella occidentalis]
MVTVDEYYLRQAQTGSGLPYYSGISGQRGHGFGSFLGGLFRTIVPLFTSGAKMLGSEALRAGTGVLADMAAGQNPVESLKRRGAAAGHSLVDRLSGGMQGNGIKRARGRRSVQSGRVARRGNTRAAPKRSTLRDIFH